MTSNCDTGSGPAVDGKRVAARVDAAELCFTRPSVDLEPFESEHEGYTGKNIKLHRNLLEQVVV